MNVLIADDQADVTQAIAAGVDWKKLSVDGVFLAYSVKEARRIFDRERIHILLCDIEMPPVTGFELVDWANKRWPDLIVIFLSSHANFEYARKAVGLGSYDYILQPAPYEEIEKSVLRAVSRAGDAIRRHAATSLGEGSPGAADADLPDNNRPVEKVKEYVRKNLDRDLSRSEIAESVFLNPEYLSHLFRRETGCALGEYIVNEKMKIAEVLLKDTNIKVSLVAAKVGFASFSYFSQVFRRRTGLSPLEYRARQREIRNV